MVDKQAIQSNQIQQAGVVLADMIKTCEVYNLTFLKQIHTFKKIRLRVNEPNFSILVGVLFTNLCVLAGIKEKLDHATKGDLYRSLKNYYLDLTLEEIYKAFELERNEQYPKKSSHFQLFGVDYFSEVIKKYRIWKPEHLTKHHIAIDVKNQLPEKTTSQIKQDLDNGIILRFNEFKAFKPMTEPIVHIYQELLDRGIILGAITPKLKAYYDQKQKEATQELKKELEQEITINYASKRKDFQKILKQVQGGESYKIIDRTKKIVLQEYFTKLISENKNIEEILNNQP